MQNHYTSGATHFHLYFYPPILTFNTLLCSFLPSFLILFFYMYFISIHNFFLEQINEKDCPFSCVSLYIYPHTFFLHPTLSSLCTSSTNPMIRLENIVFLLGSKVLQVVYTRKQVIIFNSGSKGFTKWIIHKIGHLVKQLTLVPLSSLCNYTYQCRLKQG